MRKTETKNSLAKGKITQPILSLTENAIGNGGVFAKLKNVVLIVVGSVIEKVKFSVLYVLRFTQKKSKRLIEKLRKQPSTPTVVRFVPAAEIITLNLCPSTTSAVVGLRTDGNCVVVMDTQGVVEYASISGSRGITIQRDIEFSVETATVPSANLATALTSGSA